LGVGATDLPPPQQLQQAMSQQHGVTLWANGQQQPGQAQSLSQFGVGDAAGAAPAMQPQLPPRPPTPPIPPSFSSSIAPSSDCLPTAHTLAYSSPAVEQHALAVSTCAAAVAAAVTGTSGGTGVDMVALQAVMAQQQQQQQQRRGGSHGGAPTLWGNSQQQQRGGVAAQGGALWANSRQQQQTDHQAKTAATTAARHMLTQQRRGAHRVTLLNKCPVLV
jgi:hypothetical protein